MVDGGVTFPMLSDAGGKIVSEDRIQPKEVNFSSLATKLKKTNPKAVYYAGAHTEGSLLTKQLKEAGLDVTISPGKGTADSIKTVGTGNAEYMNWGTLLVLGRTLFWEGDRVSPLARYRIDASKNLVFDRLVDLAPEGPWRVVRSPGQAKPRTEPLPGYEDLQRDGWRWARSPAGLLLLHHRGRGFLLDNHTGQVLRTFRLPPVDPGARLEPGAVAGKALSDCGRTRCRGRRPPRTRWPRPAPSRRRPPGPPAHPAAWPARRRARRGARTARAAR